MTKNVVAASWIGKLHTWTDGTQRSYPQGGFPNSAPAFLPMSQVYPAPSGVQTWEAHQLAYYKPSNGDTFQWRKRIGVNFGRWPHRYELASGPAGMAFEATTWNTAWDGQGNAAYLAGYGVLTWTPSGSVSSQLVSVNIYDQDNNVLNVQWNISTSDDIANSGVFFFLNADTGNDSTGTGTKAAPWQTLTHALGTTLGSGGAAPAKSICVLRGASALYTFPSNGTANYLTLNANQPTSYVGYPGETATVDMTGANPTNGGLLTGLVAGTFFQDITFSGYYTGAGQNADFRLFQFASTNRLVFQGLTWVNAGFGSAATNNASMFFSSGGAPSMGNYLFITGCEETNRQSDGLYANNTPICLLYNYQNWVIELNYANSPSSNCGHIYALKSDLGYGSFRANLAVVAGGTAMAGALQAPYQSFNNVEIAYNVGVNIGTLAVPDTAGFSYGTVIAYRNNFIAQQQGLICVEPNYNMAAPYTNHNSSPYNINTLVPAISTAATGGSLAANTWYYSVTTIGVSGESTTTNGNGGHSEMSIISTGSTSVNTVPVLTVPGAVKHRFYRGTASGGENQYVDVTAVAGGVTTLTDDGTLSWTSGTPPTTDTAASASRFIFNSNVIQTPTQTSDPTGTVIQSDGHDQYAASGLLNATTGLLVTSNGGLYGAQLT